FVPKNSGTKSQSLSMRNMIVSISNFDSLGDAGVALPLFEVVLPSILLLFCKLLVLVCTFATEGVVVEVELLLIGLAAFFFFLTARFFFGCFLFAFCSVC